MNYTKGDWEAKDANSSIRTGTRRVASINHSGISKDELKANAQLIAQSPRMAEWIAKVARQDFVVFPEDKTTAKAIIRG